ncbi:hypothetical protein JRI60_50185 [Archangium violaceum]|uniref:hypothetical protein n=1 Tax=Archangium violaceum TaxID=83451 RepID=UPI00194F7C72|nr:hypothetical protein [Archangium violaceum]QRN97044.1 hypothetical protein JRI60_50185 [Archangium violaceum]
MRYRGHRGSYRDHSRWEDTKEEDSSGNGWLLALGAVALWLWSKLQEEAGARRQSEQREAEATRQAEEARREAEAAEQEAEEARREAAEARAREQQMRLRAQEAQAEAELQKRLARAAEAELKRQRPTSDERPEPQDEASGHPGAGTH